MGSGVGGSGVGAVPGSGVGSGVGSTGTGIELDNGV